MNTISSLAPAIQGEPEPIAESSSKGDRNKYKAAMKLFRNNRDARDRTIDYLKQKTIQAIDALKKGELTAFDALVGENACQIRAVKVAMIYQQYLEKRNLFQRLEQELEESSDPTLSEDERFLLLSYLLTISKEKIKEESFSITLKEKGDPSRFCEDAGSSIQTAKSADKLQHLWRQILSTDSVFFVRQLAQESDDDKLKQMCSDEYVVNYKPPNTSTSPKPTLPMYWTYKTLLQAAQKKGLPIVMKARIFQADAVNRDGTLVNGVKKQEVTLASASDSGAAIVVEGVVVTYDEAGPPQGWDRRIRENVTDVILKGAADHRQYPNSAIDDEKRLYSDEELAKYRKEAREEGYAFENPTSFFINHVYANTLERIPQ